MTYIYKRELIRIDLCPQILTVLNESLIYMLNPTHVQSHIVGDPKSTGHMAKHLSLDTLTTL